MTVPNWANQTIWTGDNLPILRGMNSESVDLIYLDPPFNSKANYAAPIGSKAAGAAFKDTWTLSDVDVEWINLIEGKHPYLYRVLLAAMTDSDKAYLVYMAVRVLEMHRLLKRTGSIYLHCDSTMSHYLKLVMDAIFGRENFRTEIVWKRTTTHSDSKTWSRVSDSVLFFSKTQRITWNTPHVPHSDEYIVSKYRHDDGDGRRYTLDNMTSPNPRPNMIYDWKGFPSPEKGWRYSKERMAQLDEESRIWYPTLKDGTYDTFRRPRLKRYLDEMKGGVMGSIWSDISPINSQAKERLGYPTQKPLALLDRIVRASSNEGDTVLDPFCGCATTLVAADRLQRRWAGIDISPKAAELVVERIQADQGLWRSIVSRTDIPQRTDLGALPHYKTHRKMLYGEQEGNCAGCATHFELRNLVVDHIIARAKGGTDHPDNLQLLCGHCNSVKGDRGMEYLRAKLQLPNVRA